MASFDGVYFGTFEVLRMNESPLLDEDTPRAFMNVVAPAKTKDAFIEMVKEMIEYYRLSLMAHSDIMPFSERFPGVVSDSVLIQKASESVESNSPRIVRLHAFPR